MYNGTKMLVLLKIKKPIQTNESAFAGGEYRIRTDHLFTASEAL